MNIEQRARQIIKKGVGQNCSDIYLLPAANGYRLIYRQSGRIKSQDELSIEEAKALIRFYKFTAKMNIAEQRRPQVGSDQVVIGSKVYYLRLSSVGNFLSRESLVIRLLHQQNDNRYFKQSQYEQLLAAVNRRGLILTSGPTGSGKTLTMYRLVKTQLPDNIVMTIEDPVEIHEPNFFQSQINPAAGIDYEDLLSAALRHRPDILIIGEIRNQTTARMVIDASLSGHLVLSTVHARSTGGVIQRLLNLGISKVELENSLSAVCYQRLIPRTNGSLACLIDIAEGASLLDFLRKPRQGFVDWSTSLKELVVTGEIADEQAKKFQEG